MLEHLEHWKLNIRNKWAKDKLSNPYIKAEKNCRIAGPTEHILIFS